MEPWALRRDLEATRTQARLIEAEIGTIHTETALLDSQIKIGEKERKILNHDLGNVEKTLGNVVERLKILECRENATLKKKLKDKEMQLVIARMDRASAERSSWVSCWRSAGRLCGSYWSAYGFFCLPCPILFVIAASIIVQILEFQIGISEPRGSRSRVDKIYSSWFLLAVLAGRLCGSYWSAYGFFCLPCPILFVIAASIIGPQTPLDFGRCDGYGLMDQWAVLVSLTEMGRR
ncbi:hypothetical protein Tco_0696660 [Tanacetum coccineum]